MKTTKKVLAIVLSVMLLLSVMPMSFAASDTQTESSVASITIGDITTYYDSLAEAIAATPDNAESATTIKVLVDTTIDSTINITNGKNVKITASKLTISGASGVDPMFYIEGGKIEFASGTITSTSYNCDVFKLKGLAGADEGYSKLVLSNSTTVNSKEYGVLITYNGKSADGVYVNAKGAMNTGLACIYTNGMIQEYGAHPAKILVNNMNAKLTCTNEQGNSLHDNAAIYAAGYAEWTFSLGTITGPTALYAKCGKITISGGSFVGNGEEVAYSHNGNGITATGAALVFENCAGYLDDFDINITSKAIISSTNSDPIQSEVYSKGADVRTAETGFVNGGTFKSKGEGADVSEFYSPELAEKFANGQAYMESSIFALDVDGRINTSAPGAKLVRDGVTYYTGNVMKAANNANPGETVTALADFTTGSQVVITNSDVTIDLDGYTVTNNNSLYPIRVQDGASATIKNGTITTTKKGIAMVGESSLVIADDCTLNGDVCSYESPVDATLDIYGTVNGSIAPTIAGTTVNIYDGATVEADTALKAASGTTINVYGGTINGAVSETGTGEVNVSGGTFDTDVTAYLAEGAIQDAETGVVTCYVAKVGDNYFDSLEAAIASISNVTSAAHSKSIDGDKVTPYYTYVANGEVELLNDANGNGLMFGEGTDLTIDFNGHTYEIDGRTVGSNGTERCGFNFAKNSDITLKNGTLTSEKAKILVQNYADLTVDDMTLTNANEGEGTFYTLSNNFGDVVITDSVVNAADNGTSYAFDISTGWASAYADGVTVTMNGTTIINGNIEVGSYANYPGTATVALYLTSGTINGEIVASAYNTSWEKVSDDIGDNIVVTKSDECSYAAPEDYKWVSNGDGTSSLEKIETKNGANLTLEGTIEEAIYLDANSYDLENDAVVKVTANASSNISEEPNVVTTTYNVKDLTPFVDPKGTYTGTYKFAIKNAPAQITEEIKVELFASASDTKPVKTITYSVKDYCDQVIADAANQPAKLVALCKAILDYARAAQLQFEYNLANMASDSFYNADAIEALTYSDITGTYLSGDFANNITNCSFQCLANTNINLYIANPLMSKDIDASIVGDDESAIKATYMISEQNGLLISVSDIEAGNLNKNFTLITSDGSITTNARTIIKTCLYYGVSETLVKTIYFYANAADAYFN